MGQARSQRATRVALAALVPRRAARTRPFLWCPQNTDYEPRRNAVRLTKCASRHVVMLAERCRRRAIASSARAQAANDHGGELWRMRHPQPPSPLSTACSATSAFAPASGCAPPPPPTPRGSPASGGTVIVLPTRDAGRLRCVRQGTTLRVARKMPPLRPARPRARWASGGTPRNVTCPGNRTTESRSSCVAVYSRFLGAPVRRPTTTLAK
jgi:hypothetical protein